MRCAYLRWLAVLAMVGATGPLVARSETIEPLLQTLCQVDREGKGNRAATQAWADLTAASDVEQLPTILSAIDGGAAGGQRPALGRRRDRRLAPLAADGQVANRGARDLSARNETRFASATHGLRMDRAVDPAGPDRRFQACSMTEFDPRARDAVARVLLTADKALADQKTDRGRLPAIARH